MPKVTKELMRTLIDAGVFPPRHQTGCLKNYVRTLPMVYAAVGMTVAQIKKKVRAAYNYCFCTCRK